MAIDRLVAGLLPSLSRSLGEQFNVFRVMHHGTHEKQLSNVFAWLLDVDATHGLGDAFQRLVLAWVNDSLTADVSLPPTGYRVTQEVDTSGLVGGVDAAEEMDVADIVLSRPEAAVVIENYATSDGHGHAYDRYLAHGRAGGRTAAVVLLCQRHDRQLLRDGWENAVVLTYAELLGGLRDRIGADASWRRRHPEQAFFIDQMIQHFVEGPAAVNVEDQIAFITAMCETGESARFGYRPIDRAAQEFADLVAEHARRQFEEGRRTLAEIKSRLRTYARTSLMTSVNEVLDVGQIQRVETRFVGTWEWSVALRRTDAQPGIFLEFGPTAVAENAKVPQPVADPDYSKVFVTMHSADGQVVERIRQTDVSLADVLDGLAPGDERLRDAVVSMARGL